MDSHGEIKRGEDFYIDDRQKVSLIKAGNTARIIICQKRNDDSPIEKVDKDHFIVKSTGELKEYTHSSNRGDNIVYLKHSLEHGRDIINANVTVSENCKFVTLTYSQRNANGELIPMTDAKQLYHDIDVYHKRFRRKYGKEVKFIIACEPQCSGAWHAHVIYVFPNKAPFIPNAEIAEMWGHGFVTVKNLDGKIDNLGAYLTSYLTSVDVEEFKSILPNVEEMNIDTEPHEIIDPKTGKRITKKVIKGARLHLYPPYFKPIRASRNCIVPKSEKTTYSKALEAVEGMSLTFETTVDFIDDDGITINKITKKYFGKR